jgi:hypothetical protein
METKNVIIIIVLLLVAFAIYKIASSLYKKEGSERYYAPSSSRSGRATMPVQRGRTGGRVLPTRGGRRVTPQQMNGAPVAAEVVPPTSGLATEPTLENTPAAVQPTIQTTPAQTTPPTTTSMLVNALANAAKSETSADMNAVNEVMTAAMYDMTTPEGVEAVATLATNAVMPSAAPVEEVNKAAAIAMTSQTSYCPANSPQPVGATPEWVNYCSELCMLNGTLNPALCPCACARSNPFVAYVN